MNVSIGDLFVAVIVPGLLLTMPIFMPIITNLGFDPVWFGILSCVNMQVSYLSPPFGPAAFCLKGAAPPGIGLRHICRTLWPFMIIAAHRDAADPVLPADRPVAARRAPRGG